LYCLNPRVAADAQRAQANCELNKATTVVVEPHFEILSRLGKFCLG
jgi:hypothetical protein